MTMINRRGGFRDDNTTDVSKELIKRLNAGDSVLNKLVVVTHEWNNGKQFEVSRTFAADSYAITSYSEYGGRLTLTALGEPVAEFAQWHAVYNPANLLGSDAVVRGVDDEAQWVAANAFPTDNPSVPPVAEDSPLP